MASQFPVVFLTGPRQSGKTTWARALRDSNGLLHQHRGSVILDEVQRAPDLLSAIQVNVDEDPTPGGFFLTGSQQLPLAHAISQTLAGRAGSSDWLSSYYQLLNLTSLGSDCGVSHTTARAWISTLQRDLRRG